jgi:hypothetical protein
MSNCRERLLLVCFTIATVVSAEFLQAEDRNSSAIDSRSRSSEALFQAFSETQDSPLVQLTGLENGDSDSEYGHTQYELSSYEVEHECWWCRMGLGRTFCKHQREEKKEREVRLARKVKGQTYYDNFPAYYTTNHGYHKTCWRKMTESCDRCPPSELAPSTPALEVAPPVPAQPIPPAPVPPLPKK